MIDERFYEGLVRDFSSWGKPLEDPSLQQKAGALLAAEARLLDQGRFEDWLGLYAAECVYWVPATPGGDPRREVAVAFDDRRRLEDRVYRLRTGTAWSQVPASRTARLVSNVEVFENRMVRATFLVYDWRAGETQLWAGWYGYRLRDDGGLKIEVKQVNLLDCDQSLRNPSIVL